MELLSYIGERWADWWQSQTATGMLMLTFGMFGQALFVSRWFVQWLASERARKSIVPELFWYLSLVGGLMVLTYGIYSTNPVLILGQFGVFIYARNIYLIWRNKREAADENAPPRMPAE
ncbi:MAG: lipid-A-disaccharide synthase N-terminal domain-containing protein [Pseudomonadota bacterium]